MNALNKTLVIGGGHIGRRHIDALTKIGSKVTLVENNKDIKLDQLKIDDIYSKVEEVPDIERYDFGVICLPNFLHYQYSKNLLTKGMNLIVEKPLCLDVQEAEQLLDLSDQLNKQIFVVKQNRLVDSMINLKQTLDNGDLGHLLSFSMEIIWNRDENYFKQTAWRGKKELDGGSLYTQFSHYVDLIEWLFGKIKLSSGFKENYMHSDSSETEDSICTSLILESGSMGSLHLSINAFERNLGNRFLMLFEKGSLVLEGSNFDNLAFNTTDNDFNGKQVELIKFFLEKNSENAHDRFYFFMKEVLSQRKKDNFSFLATGLDGLNNLKTIDLIYKNLK
jgi:predicted dehydrogenase